MNIFTLVLSMMVQSTCLRGRQYEYLMSTLDTLDCMNSAPLSKNLLLRPFFRWSQKAAALTTAHPRVLSARPATLLRPASFYVHSDNGRSLLALSAAAAALLCRQCAQETLGQEGFLEQSQHVSPTELSLASFRPSVHSPSFVRSLLRPFPLSSAVFRSRAVSPSTNGAISESIVSGARYIWMQRAEERRG